MKRKELKAQHAADRALVAKASLHGSQVQRLGHLSTLYINQLPLSSAALEDFVGNMPSLRSLGTEAGEAAEQEAGAGVWARLLARNPNLALATL